MHNDNYTDAAVLLHVVYDGIGYDNTIVFVVLQNFPLSTFTNGVIIGEGAISQIDTFSTDNENKKIILQFLDRQPGQPKAVAPSIPTLLKLKV